MPEFRGPEDGIIPHTHWSYWASPDSRGWLWAYTTLRDKETGFFYSFAFKPRGKRTNPEFYEYVPRTKARAASRNKAKDRAYKMIRGVAASSLRKKLDMPPTPPKEKNMPGMGFCMKEKKTVVIANAKQIAKDNGRLYIRGQCPDCKTAIQKLGRLIDCPECGHTAEGASDDYICKLCRIKETT